MCVYLRDNRCRIRLPPVICPPEHISVDTEYFLVAVVYICIFLPLHLFARDTLSRPREGA